MTLKSSRCSKKIRRKRPLCWKMEFKSSVLENVDLSWSSLPTNSICSDPALEGDFRLTKRRKMDEKCYPLLENSRDTTIRNLTVSGCNSSPAQKGNGKTFIVSSLQISNSGANTAGYKGDHEELEEASAGIHLRNLAGSQSGVDNGPQSSTSRMPDYSNHGRKNVCEHSLSDAYAAKPVMDLISAKDLCISILRSDIFPTKESELSQKSVPDDNESNPLFECMGCESMEDPSKMLICDRCEGAFHLYCCKPRVRNIPQEKWYCQVCSRKKPKGQRRKLSCKHELPNPVQRPTRGLGTIQDMLVDAEPYETRVRIGTNFQADVPEWSGLIPRNEDTFGEASELDPSETTTMGHLQLFKDKKSGVGNWIQCREVLETGVVCGKWRRAPLFVVQSSNWDCSCSVIWDPIHADCAVPQELETDEILKQLKFINKLKDRLGDKKKQ